MKVKIQSIHFDADRKLLDFTEEKVSKLSHFYDGIIGGEVFLRLDKSSTDENKVAEIKLMIPGNDLFAKRQCRTFEEAVDTSIEALARQVKRHKDKLRNL